MTCGRSWSPCVRSLPCQPRLAYYSARYARFVPYRTIHLSTSRAEEASEGNRDASSVVKKQLTESQNVRTRATMTIQQVPAAHTGHITTLRMTSNATRNAISRAFLRDLSEEVELIHAEQAAGTSATRALIIASTSERVFCAGADLKERKNMSEDETEDFLIALRHTFARLSALPVPTIAEVSGAALGGGLELALCCHIRVFSQNAIVGLPEVKLAIIPGAGGTFRLAQAIGKSQAREAILTGRRFEGLEAYKIGLCHRLVRVHEGNTETEKHMNTSRAAMKLAQDISEGGPVAISAALEAIEGGSQDAENAAYRKVLKTKDRVVALQAFANKEKPRFSGT